MTKTNQEPFKMGDLVQFKEDLVQPVKVFKVDKVERQARGKCKYDLSDVNDGSKSIGGNGDLVPYKPAENENDLGQVNKDKNQLDLSNIEEHYQERQRKGLEKRFLSVRRFVATPSNATEIEVDEAFALVLDSVTQPIPKEIKQELQSLLSHLLEAQTVPIKRIEETDVRDLISIWRMLPSENSRTQKWKQEIVFKVIQDIRPPRPGEQNALCCYLELSDMNEDEQEVRADLVRQLLTEMPVGKLFDFFRLISPDIILRTVRNCHEPRVRQSAVESLSIRLTEVINYTWYQRRPFEKVRESIENFLLLLNENHGAEDYVLIRLFGLLAESMTRALDLMMSGDTQGADTFMSWIEQDLFPQFTEQAKRTFGLQLVVSLLKNEDASRDARVLYGLLKQIVNLPIAPEVALREIAGLPTVHRDAFWRYLLDRTYTLEVCE